MILLLLIGQLEGFYVPLYDFNLTPVNHSEMVQYGFSMDSWHISKGSASSERVIPHRDALTILNFISYQYSVCMLTYVGFICNTKSTSQERNCQFQLELILVLTDILWKCRYTRTHFSNSARANLISHKSTVDNELQNWNLIQNRAHYNIRYDVINILQFP